MSRKADHITLFLIELHWLPVEQRIINFKILLFTYKIVNGLAPTYLSELLVPYVLRRDLRSADKFLFCQYNYHIVPNFMGLERSRLALLVCGTNYLWTSSSSPSISIFKQKLKTHFFKLAYY